MASLALMLGAVVGVQSDQDTAVARAIDQANLEMQTTTQAFIDGMHSISTHLLGIVSADLEANAGANSEAGLTIGEPLQTRLQTGANATTDLNAGVDTAEGTNINVQAAGNTQVGVDAGVNLDSGPLDIGGDANLQTGLGIDLGLNK